MRAVQLAIAIMCPAVCNTAQKHMLLFGLLIPESLLLRLQALLLPSLLSCTACSSCGQRWSNAMEN
jgi:hypothetical protein